MSPVYVYHHPALLTLMFMLQASAEPFLGAVRDCYEAYIVYTFMAMLVEVSLKCYIVCMLTIASTINPHCCDLFLLQILGNNNGPNAAVLVLESQIREDRRALNELDDMLDREDRALLAERSQEYIDDNADETQGLQLSSHGTSSTASITPPLLARVNSASHDLLAEASASTTASLHDVRPPCPCSYDERNPKSIAAAILYQCQVLDSHLYVEIILKLIVVTFIFYHFRS
jgi:hypothetical protein